ncbi:MAG: imidazoleglycerol-phosphate dehydratase HisB [Armatimonadetes bacterium]|nr:imidazoleglycerol-phosphate dehydratase HisB [Armatimonadota bacterium]MDW8121945.1 imidazoleglycerol-phosphate dehydratase HisB [Armatimonadota bacterium]
MVRSASVERKTKETNVAVVLELDGTGQFTAQTGVGFFDHMLTALGHHAFWDGSVRAQGDLEVDAHHTVEDVGIVLGQAIDRALGDRRGIARFGSAVVPMDEALVLCSVDISGRGYSFIDLPVPGPIGSFDPELATEFFKSLAAHGRFTLHIKLLSGNDRHHIVEAAFKALAVAFRQAAALSLQRQDAIPSTKGTLKE